MQYFQVFMPHSQYVLPGMQTPLETPPVYYLGICMELCRGGVEVECLANWVIADAGDSTGVNDLYKEVVTAGAGSVIQKVFNGCFGELAIAWGTGGCLGESKWQRCVDGCATGVGTRCVRATGREQLQAHSARTNGAKVELLQELVHGVDRSICLTQGCEQFDGLTIREQGLTTQF